MKQLARYIILFLGFCLLCGRLSAQGEEKPVERPTISELAVCDTAFYAVLNRAVWGMKGFHLETDRYYVQLLFRINEGKLTVIASPHARAHYGVSIKKLRGLAFRNWRCVGFKNYGGYDFLVVSEPDIPTEKILCPVADGENYPVVSDDSHSSMRDGTVARWKWLGEETVTGFRFTFLGAFYD